jgi:hypothetical protein
MSYVHIILVSIYNIIFSISQRRMSYRFISDSMRTKKMILQELWQCPYRQDIVRKNVMRGVRIER